MTSLRISGLKARLRQEKGLESSVGYALLLPALLSIVVLAIQAMLFYQAKAVALAGASECARAAAAVDGNWQSGYNVAADYMAHNRSGISGYTISVDRNTTQASCSITATPQILAVGVDLHTTQHAVLPVEKYS